LMAKDSDSKDSQRKNVAVNDVVSGAAGPLARQVEEHRHIGN
jgi:hypothetical protein